MIASSFIQAADGINQLPVGDSVACKFSQGVQESCESLFFALVRDIPNSRLTELMGIVFDHARKTSNPDIVVDVFLMTFQTRHCRGGRGGEDNFFKMIFELVIFYPQTVESLLYLIPHYGSFKDWFQIVDIVSSDKIDIPTKTAMVPLVNTIIDLAAKQLIIDQLAFDEMEKSQSLRSTLSCKPGISLLAKWAPRENGHFNKQVRVLANNIFPTSKAPKKEYRQMISRLNRSLDCLVSMSSNRWNEVDFWSAPSNCTMKNRKLFLNEMINLKHSSSQEKEKGNRYYNEVERVDCRKRLSDTMLQTGAQELLKVRQLLPHKMVKKLMGRNAKDMSKLEKDLISYQWSGIKANVINSMAIVRKNNLSSQQEHKNTRTYENSIDLGKLVPIVDVSSSMIGTPIEVAIALGILVSELSSSAFANRCMTFSDKPTWVQFDKHATLSQKIHDMRKSEWGVNTNFERATELVLQSAINAKLEPDEIPNLIVFSDMQFDQASSGTWETHHEKIVRRFNTEGLRTCGKKWPTPHIIYWNLRGCTNGFPAQINSPNVTMLTGFSSSLLKLLLDGEPLKQMSSCNYEEKVASRTPFSTVRAALDSNDYNAIRRVLSASNEGLLKQYKASEEFIGEIKERQPVDEEDWVLVY